MRTLLINVDTQVDFMMSSGKLYVPGSDILSGPLQKLMVAAMRSGSVVVHTQDWHDESDAEFASFPKHCVAGSFGAEIFPFCRIYSNHYSRTYDINQRPYPLDLNNSGEFILHKKTYNVWDKDLGNPSALSSIINHFAPSQILLSGVATDICVVAAAKGLYEFLHSSERKFDIPKLWLIRDATRGLSLESETEAVSKIMNWGFARVSVDEISCAI